MAAKRPFHVTATLNGRRADIRMTGRIASDGSTIEGAFEQQVNDLVNAGVRSAHVYMDGEGGSVFGAIRIANVIKKFPGLVTGEGGAMVASAYTYIALQLQDFEMPKNGMYMIHKPGMETGGNEDDIGADLVALKLHTDAYRKAYAEKTGKTEAEIEALWGKGDVWMTAEQAKAAGFIDGVIGEEEMTAEAVARIAACGCPKDKLPIAAVAASTEDTMDIKALRVQLGMPESATEQDVLAKVKQLQDNAVATTAAAAAARATEVKSMIDAAVTAKKITEAHRKGFENKFAADFDATKAELEAIVPVASMVSASAGVAAEAPKGREAWKYEEWATKDEKGLMAMMKSEPDKFTALYEERYGVKPTLPKA
jgi:ATP-dependent Clp protease protease subunit